MPYLQWVLDEFEGLKHVPRLAIALLAVASAVSIWASRWYYTRTISNLKSQADLQQTELEGRNATIANLRNEVGQLRQELNARLGRPPGPLPRYSLGGSNVLAYTSEGWTNQDTATVVELDWGSMAGLDADAVLRLRTEGDPGWVQARVVNTTDGEVVATTERHNGPRQQVRLRLPRSRGVKTYAMQVRGQNAGLEGEIQLVRSTSTEDPR